MPADPSSPAENQGHASQGHPAEERPDPGAFARQLFEHLADVHGEANADLYLARIARALEKIAEEIARIRAAMEDEDRKEDGRQ